MHMSRADEVSGQSHCNLWWRWWWSDAMWETLIRLWLYELSYCLQVFVAYISLQFWRYMGSYDSVVGVCAGSWVFSTTGCAYIVWTKGTPGYAVNFSGLHFCWNALPNIFCNMQREETREPHSRLNGYAWTMLDHIFYDRLWLEPLPVQKLFFQLETCVSVLQEWSKHLWFDHFVTMWFTMSPTEYPFLQAWFVGVYSSFQLA